LIAAYRCGSHRAQWLCAIAPYRFMFGILIPGQLQQVLERELTIDLGLVPPPPRYHARVTLGRTIWPGWLAAGAPERP
jgi:hypothetical protein